MSTKQLPICVDIDNVVAQTDVVIRDLISRHSNGAIRLSYEDVVDFDYWKCPDCNGRRLARSEWDEVHERFSQPDVIQGIAPMMGARENIEALRVKYAIHLVSSRRAAAHEATRTWLAMNKIPFDELIFTAHGTKHDLASSYAAVVEDHYEQALAFATKGVRAILISHPWNRQKPEARNLSWAQNWTQVREKLT